MFADKGLNIQIFGALMKRPDLLMNSDKYFLVPDDFSSVFERNIFAAIFNMHQNGATRINAIDIDGYLQTVPGAHTIFTRDNGIEFLEDCEELANVENFDYYYQRLKKLNALRDLKRLGYPTEQFYCEELTEEAKAINSNFDSLTLMEIFDSCKKDIATLENKYNSKYTNVESTAFDGVVTLISELRNNPEVGPALPGHILNTIVRGARKGKFYLRSASSGAGKTRGLVGDACALAYPIRYDNTTQQWVRDGDTEKVLYIVTEQDISEVQTMIVAYLSGVNEEKLLYNSCNFDEEERVQKAIQVMEFFKNNFHIVKISDPNISIVKSVVRKYYFEHGIGNLFYDYIFSSPGLLTEFRDLKVREDVLLNIMSTSLKDLGADLGIFVESATQLNRGSEDGKTGVKNEKNIRGAMSIVDKCDIAYIFSRPNPEEIEAIEPFVQQYGVVPNQVSDIYKVRRGRFVNVRVWSYFDYGTCRKRDLFITNGNYMPIDEFEAMFFINKNPEDVSEILNVVNGVTPVKAPTVEASSIEESKNEPVVAEEKKPEALPLMDEQDNIYF